MSLSKPFLPFSLPTLSATQADVVKVVASLFIPRYSRPYYGLTFDELLSGSLKFPLEGFLPGVDSFVQEPPPPSATLPQVPWEEMIFVVNTFHFLLNI